MDGSVARMQRHLKTIRICCGLSQEEFAYRLGISRATVINWEKGSTPFGKFEYHAVSHVIEGYEDEFLKKLIFVLVEGPYWAECDDAVVNLSDSIRWGRMAGMQEARRAYIEKLEPIVDEWMAVMT